jgi:hypothetical protein
MYEPNFASFQEFAGILARNAGKKAILAKL